MAGGDNDQTAQELHSVWRDIIIVTRFYIAVNGFNFVVLEFNLERLPWFAVFEILLLFFLNQIRLVISCDSR